jgi:hypothetical protein
MFAIGFTALRNIPAFLFRQTYRQGNPLRSLYKMATGSVRCEFHGLVKYRFARGDAVAELFLMRGKIDDSESSIFGETIFSHHYETNS